LEAAAPSLSAGAGAARSIATVSPLRTARALRLRARLL
jgi:hypothetical protein